MPRVAQALNPVQLDKRIADAVDSMNNASGPTAVRIAVGGHPPGLLLQVMPSGSSSWIFRRVAGGRRRMIGIGPHRGADGAKGLSLAAARKEASKLADAIGEGRDPLAEKRSGQVKQMTFRECADAFIAVNRDGWRNDKHAAQWSSTLEKWAYPKIGALAVASIDRNHVEGVLTQPVEAANGRPLWNARHETATRVRQRIEKILDYASARDFRSGDNPARWRGNLEPIMPAVSKATKQPKHHAALAYKDAPAFITALRTREGTAARALEFTILTAARSGEVRMMDWAEVDLDAALWTVPEGRMKAHKEHTVPLGDAAMAILTAIPEENRDGLVFPGATAGKAMSDMTLAAVLKRMECTEITVHGFRSTFRDWAGEYTAHPRDVIENALAHALKDKAEAAYARGTQLAKRRRLMDDWAAYVNGTGGDNVVPIEAARA